MNIIFSGEFLFFAVVLFFVCMIVRLTLVKIDVQKLEIQISRLDELFVELIPHLTKIGVGHYRNRLTQFKKCLNDSIWSLKINKNYLEDEKEEFEDLLEQVRIGAHISPYLPNKMRD